MRGFTKTTPAIVVGALLAVAGLAAAAEKAGVKMADTVQVAGRTLQLNGLGVREATWLDVDVYVAGLYLEQRSAHPGEIIDSDQVKLMQLRFVRDVDRDDVVKAVREGFENNVSDDELGALQPRIAKLLGWLPAFSDGGQLTFTYIPGRGTNVAINGKSRGWIEGEDFGRALFATWLGPKPPNSGLKSGLLGR